MIYVGASLIRCASSRPETIAVGSPIPGRVLALAKYRFLYLGCCGFGGRSSSVGIQAAGTGFCFDHDELDTETSTLQLEYIPANR
jgi:hypothetical protein